MLKTLSELNVKPLTGKCLSPDIRKLNNTIYQYSTTPISKGKATEIIDMLSLIQKTNKMPDIQLYMNILQTYVVNFKWTDEDIQTLQRVINYNVAYWIKTKNVDTDEVILSHLKRWLNTKEMIDESPYKNELKLNSFNRLNKEYLDVLINRYS